MPYGYGVAETEERVGLLRILLFIDLEGQFLLVRILADGDVRT